MRELSVAEFALFITCCVVSVGGTLLIWTISGHQSLNNLNPLLVSLAILQIFIVLIALGGYWIFRGLAERAAHTEAKEYLDREIPMLVKAAVSELLPSIRREALQYMRKSSDNADDDGLQSMMDGLDDE